MSTNISVDASDFIISCEYFDNARVKSMPDRTWSPVHKVWIAPVNKTNAIYIENTFKATEIDAEALAAIVTEKAFIPVTEPFPADFEFKTQPMTHQSEALQRAWSGSEFALFMDMGTGKTWTTINLAGARWMTGKIKALLVVCPTSVKPVWLNELAAHCSVPYNAYVHEAGQDKAARAFIFNESPTLKVMIVGVESLSQGKAWQHINSFCSEHDTMMAIDESSTIKTSPKSKGGKIVPSRTSRCWDAGEMCKYRVIMTGTPITQGIQDLFAQFRFLNWEIIGNKNYYSFKARYTVSGGFQNKKIIGYANVDELMDRVRDYQYSIKITDVMDMPEQVYEQRFCTPNAIQARLLQELGNPYDMSTYLGDLTLDCETILERMTRYQQIVGGHFPFEDENGYGIEVIPGKNPKMEELISILDSLDDDRKVVIWARFVPEQKLIYEYLTGNYDDVLWYKGGLSTGERGAIINDFQTGPSRFLVSGGAGYRGLTLTAANLNIYYSNTFSYDDREQSERRTWRKGQEHPTVYLDLTMNHIIDKSILKALKAKEDLAKFVDRQLQNPNSQ